MHPAAANTAPLQPDTGAPRCIICLDGSPPPIQLGCGCRGDAGLAHPDCQVAAARASGKWTGCGTCGVGFSGKMEDFLTESRLADTQGNTRHIDWPTAVAVRAKHLGEMGRFHEMKEQLEAALEESLRRERLNLPGSSIMFVAAILGYGLVDSGEYEKCKALLGGLIPTHADADVCMCLAIAHGKLGHFEDALRLYQVVIDKEGQHEGVESEKCLRFRIHIPKTLCDMARFEEAHVAQQELVTLQRRVLGPEHLVTLITEAIRTQILSEENRFADGEKECRRLLPIVERVYGPVFHLTSTLHTRLMHNLMNQGKLSEVEWEGASRLLILKDAFGPDHESVIELTQNLESVAELRRKQAETYACTSACQRQA